ncbi:MAG: YwbE family protein [Bacillus sp. (in: firmicutes)]
MPHTRRSNLAPGMTVDIVLKKDQRTGALTRGTIKRLLTNSSVHPHGIKVELTDGQVGRVKHIIKEA